jgi:hypothetical protein
MKTSFTIILCLFTFVCFSQSKEETTKWIQEKVSGIASAPPGSPNSYRKLHNAEISFDEHGHFWYEITEITHQGNQKYESIYRLKSISIYSDLISMKFKPAENKRSYIEFTCKRSGETKVNKYYTYDEVFDSRMFERIKKAVYHLKALLRNKQPF